MSTPIQQGTTGYTTTFPSATTKSGNSQPQAVPTAMGMISGCTSDNMLLQDMRRNAYEGGKDIKNRVVAAWKNFTSGVKAVATEVYNTVQRTVYGTGIGCMAGSVSGVATYIGLGALFGANPLIGSIAVGVGLGMAGFGTTTGAVIGATYPLLKEGVYRLVRGNVADLKAKNIDLQFKLDQQKEMMAKFSQSGQILLYTNKD